MLTYSELIAALADEINRDDLTDVQIPRAIDFVERYLNTILRLPEMEEVVSSITAGGTITLPSDCLQMRSVYLGTDPKIPLQQITPSQLREKFNGGDIEGVPEYYSLQSANEIVFGPTPDDEYPSVLNYFASIPALSVENPSNWLLLTHPDIYFDGALWRLNGTMKDFDEAALRKRTFDEGVARLQRQGQGKRYGAAPLRMRPDSRVY